METLHHICKQMRDLRRAAGLTLPEAAGVVGLPAIVLGSYERGDRQPPLEKAEQVLNGYGYTIAAIPKDEDAVRLPADMATELRAIAKQLETGKRKPKPVEDVDLQEVWAKAL